MGDSLWRLRHRCHGQLARIDEAATKARDRAFAATADTQFPEFSALMLIDLARLRAAESGRDWIVELNAIVTDIVRRKIQQTVGD